MSLNVLKNVFFWEAKTWQILLRYLQQRTQQVSQNYKYDVFNYI